MLNNPETLPTRNKLTTAPQVYFPSLRLMFDKEPVHFLFWHQVMCAEETLYFCNFCGTDPNNIRPLKETHFKSYKGNRSYIPNFLIKRITIDEQEYFVMSDEDLMRKWKGKDKLQLQPKSISFLLKSPKPSSDSQSPNNEGSKRKFDDDSGHRKKLTRIEDTTPAEPAIPALTNSVDMTQSLALNNSSAFPDDAFQGTPPNVHNFEPQPQIMENAQLIQRVHSLEQQAAYLNMIIASLIEHNQRMAPIFSAMFPPPAVNPTQSNVSFFFNGFSGGNFSEMPMNHVTYPALTAPMEFPDGQLNESHSPHFFGFAPAGTTQVFPATTPIETPKNPIPKPVVSTTNTLGSSK